MLEPRSLPHRSWSPAAFVLAVVSRAMIARDPIAKLGLVLGAAFSLGASCNTQVYSPPARPFPLESAAALGAREVGVQAAGGFHGDVGDLGGGLSALSGTLTVRYGVGAETDVSGEMSVLEVQGQSTTSPFVFSGRTGVKHEIVAGLLSMTAGVGGGGSAGGAFFSPDVGVILAAENPSLVPWLQLRASFSAPFDRRLVDTGAGACGAECGFSLPPFTWATGGIFGLRLPLGWCRRGRCPMRGSILCGVGLTALYPQSGPEATIGSVALGSEVVF
jgi:hypothetical protein